MPAGTPEATQETQDARTSMGSPGTGAATGLQTPMDPAIVIAGELGESVSEENLATGASQLLKNPTAGLPSKSLLPQKPKEITLESIWEALVCLEASFGLKLTFVNQQIESLSGKLPSLDQKMETLSKDNENNSKAIQSCQQLQVNLIKENLYLQNKLEMLENYQRSNTLRLLNFPKQLSISPLITFKKYLTEVLKVPEQSYPPISKIFFVTSFLKRDSEQADRVIPPVETGDVNLTQMIEDDMVGLTYISGLSLKYTMKGWTLILCLVGRSFALPIFPQLAVRHGMGSVSLETRPFGSPYGMGVNKMPSYPGYGYKEPFVTMWTHGFLPPHLSNMWRPQRPQEHENQQYEYNLPVHPPPLPSLPTLFQPQQPGLPALNLPQQPTVMPVQQGQQPAIQQGQPALQQGEPTLIQQQVAPADGQPQQIYPFIYKLMHQEPKQQVPEQQTPMQQVPTQQLPGLQIPMQQVPMQQVPMQQLPGLQVPMQQVPMQPPQQQPLYPGLYYMPYTAGNRGAPARLGIVSSEEIQGGMAGMGAYSAIYPGFVGMGPGFGGMPQNPGFQGDFTVEDDLPAKGGQAIGQGGVVQFPNGNIPAVGANPVPGQTVIIPEGNPAAPGPVLPNPNIYYPNLGLDPVGQSKLPMGITPASVPAVTDDTFANYLPVGTEATTPLGIQQEIPMTFAESTVSPDIQGISFVENEFRQPLVMQDQGYFQEP
ncbi:ameloblastin [Microcaecilia unicolor]|uniref:Ameloblastin n=1 Tax=Microcaecilia unicolor TaxID=1415580 RepID=A0A6P7XCW4_9AMPH|nr:ameloblastin [Microcaecilia unicolor]